MELNTLLLVRQAGVSFVFTWYFYMALPLLCDLSVLVTEDERRFLNLLYMKDMIEGAFSFTFSFLTLYFIFQCICYQNLK